MARALLMKQSSGSESIIDIDAIEISIRSIEKGVNQLGDIETWATTMESNSRKILERIRITTGKLNKKIEKLDRHAEILGNIN